MLWDIDAENVNAMYAPALNAHRTRHGLPPVDNVRDHVYSGTPLLAADAVLWPSEGVGTLDLEQTGAWILPDSRPLDPALVSFLEAGSPPVYVGFGSMPMHSARDVAQVAVDAIRAQGRRVLMARGPAGRGDGGGEGAARLISTMKGAFVRLRWTKAPFILSGQACSPSRSSVIKRRGSWRWSSLRPMHRFPMPNRES